MKNKEKNIEVLERWLEHNRNTLESIKEIPEQHVEVFHLAIYGVVTNVRFLFDLFDKLEEFDLNSPKNDNSYSLKEYTEIVINHAIEESIKLIDQYKI